MSIGLRQEVASELRESFRESASLIAEQIREELGRGAHADAARIRDLTIGAAMLAETVDELRWDASSGMRAVAVERLEFWRDAITAMLRALPAEGKKRGEYEDASAFSSLKPLAVEKEWYGLVEGPLLEIEEAIHGGATPKRPGTEDD